MISEHFFSCWRAEGGLLLFIGLYVDEEDDVKVVEETGGWTGASGLDDWFEEVGMLVDSLCLCVLFIGGGIVLPTAFTFTLRPMSGPFALITLVLQKN